MIIMMPKYLTISAYITVLIIFTILINSKTITKQLTIILKMVLTGLGFKIVSGTAYSSLQQITAASKLVFISLVYIINYV